MLVVQLIIPCGYLFEVSFDEHLRERLLARLPGHWDALSHWLLVVLTANVQSRFGIIYRKLFWSTAYTRTTAEFDTAIDAILSVGNNTRKTYVVLPKVGNSSIVLRILVYIAIMLFILVVILLTMMPSLYC